LFAYKMIIFVIALFVEHNNIYQRIFIKDRVYTYHVTWKTDPEDYQFIIIRMH